ncbi:MAG: substrate-binding domain-containing protein [Fimbriimonas sp.]
MKLGTMLMAAMAVVVMAGCGSGGGDTGTTGGTAGTGTPTAGTEGGGKTFRIAMIAKSSNNPVFQSAKVGAEKAAEELGAKNNTSIKIEWLTPNEEDGTVQAQRLAQAVNDGVDAVLISCSDAAKVTGAINDAVDKGIPVMTFDSDAPMSKRFAFFGADDISCGTQVMEELGKLGGDQPLNIAILAGNQNAPNLQKRVQGVRDAMAKFPNAKVVSVVNHVESTQDASAAVIREMNAKPEINAWAMVGGWPLFGTSLLTSLDASKVKVVAVDALPGQLAYVENGLAPVLLAQPVYDWGYKSVGIIVDKVILKKDVPVIHKMELVKVSKDNLSEWAKTLQDWGMEVDAKYLAK